MVAEDIPELGVKAAGVAAAGGGAPKKPYDKSGPDNKKGCGCASDDGGAAGTAALSALVALLMIRSQRRKSS